MFVDYITYPDNKSHKIYRLQVSFTKGTHYFGSCSRYDDRLEALSIAYAVLSVKKQTLNNVFDLCLRLL